mmetsp:Transcript_42325/g.49472  ORF Transcript_42325/g.49472 Transcript_42325/m.49472 type:complete len:172 (-) Transcript_42325:173-688(-)
MVKLFKSTKALAFILNILLARDTFAQKQIRGITHNNFNKFEVKKSDPFLDAKVQANFEFCESIPGFISMLLCAFVPFYEKLCPDNCGSAEDDDGDDDNNATSLLLSESNVIIQPEERLFEMVQQSLEFCEAIPSFITTLLCSFVPQFEMVCCDACSSEENDDNINATSIIL